MSTAAPDPKTRARDHFHWIDHLASDPKISANAVRVGLVLRSYVNANGIAWPSIATIAAKVGLNRRSVISLCEELVVAGYFERIGKRQGGRAQTNVLKILLDQTVQPASPFSGQKDAASFTHWQAKGCNSTSKTVQNDARKGEASFTRTTPEPPRAHARGDDEGEGSPSGAGAPDGAPRQAKRFEEFWRQYPKRIAEDSARGEYQKILDEGRATEEQLTLGAMKYAAACEGREPKYIASAVNWLRGGRWKDEYQQPQAETRQYQSAAEAMFVNGDDDDE